MYHFSLNEQLTPSFKLLRITKGLISATLNLSKLLKYTTI